MTILARISSAFLILALYTSCIPTLHANELPEGIEEQLSVTTSPQVPGPNTETTITVRSFSTNLNAADIAWYVDGALIQRDIGITSFQFTTKGTGGTTQVDVLIIKNEGGQLSRSFTFTPAELELLVEARNYVPPFYKGRKIFTHESPYRVAAVPKFIGSNGAAIPKTDLIYTWKVDGNVQLDKSGYGKSVFDAEGSIISRTFTVTAEVTDRNGTLNAKKTITIEPEVGDVLLYEDNPLYGVMYERAIETTFHLDRQELALVAVPFFFDITSPRDTRLSYQWKMLGRSIVLPANENQLVVRNVENIQGSTPVSLFVRHLDKILQLNRTSTTLTYDEISE